MNIVISVEHRDDITDLLEDNGIKDADFYGFGDDADGRGYFHDWSWQVKNVKMAEKLCSQLAGLDLDFDVYYYPKGVAACRHIGS